MSELKAAIDVYDAEKKKNVPVEILNTMVEATAGLKRRNLEAGSLGLGARAPDFSLPDHTGQMRTLDDLLAEGVVVLNFYRGGWCPYCNMELNALQRWLPEIEAVGGKLVAVAPELPDKSLTTREKNNLQFEVLSDPGNVVARNFGLVFELPEALRPIYAKIGIDIPAYNGDESFEIPMPATYIIGRDGEIRYAFIDADYTQRLEPEVIVQELQQMAES
ncbi:MAG: AhpC/TSA family protein [Gammaproteobacteria bacterium]|nr:AhpC/TSA family protein [Gammaproteobacteria bacterium]